MTVMVLLPCVTTQAIHVMQPIMTDTSNKAESFKRNIYGYYHKQTKETVTFLLV